MRKYSLIPRIALPFIACAALFSCNKVKDALKVNVPVTMTTDLTFPVIPAAGDTTITANVNADIDQLIKNNNAQFGVKNIRSVEISSCSVSLAPPVDATDNLTAFNSLKVSLASDKKTDWADIAEADNITATDSLSLQVNTNTDLKDYFTGKTFSYKIAGSLRRPTTHEMQCHVKITFKVTVGL